MSKDSQSQSVSARSQRHEPQLGEVWRECRTAYAKRTVLVREVTDRFVYTVTLTLDDGRKADPQRRNRVRRDLWHQSWIWEPKAGDSL